MWRLFFIYFIKTQLEIPRTYRFTHWKTRKIWLDGNY